MHTRIPRITALAVILLAALLLSACSGQAQPAPQPAGPAPKIEATTATEAVAATEPPTAAPTATTEPSPAPAPTAVPSPTLAPSSVAGAAMPDAKADPKAALLYSASGKGLQSATFTYDMNMKMAPADDASSNALGAAASVLSNLAVKASGTGAMQVVDAAKGLANVQMDINTEAMGQKIVLQSIVVSGTTWTRVGTDGVWQKADVKTPTANSQAGVDPGNMFLAFDNATDVKWLDDAPLNGKPVHHLSFSIDPAKLNLNTVLQNSQGGKATPEEIQSMMQNAKIDGEAWLGADDLLPRQEKVTINWVMPLPGGTGINANLKVDMDTLMAFDKVNEPVEIKAPAQ